MLKYWVCVVRADYSSNADFQESALSPLVSSQSAIAKHIIILLHCVQLQVCIALVILLHCVK